MDAYVSVCAIAHSGECVLYANSVNVYKLLQPILIRFSLVCFMEMHSDYTAEDCLHPPDGEGSRLLTVTPQPMSAI